MAGKVNLDAMIPRADFATEGQNDTSGANIQSISLRDLVVDGSFLIPHLRKPDFQRETNHWSPRQITVFVKSYLEGELIPSLILWRSQGGNIFVIDGGHRLSALRAWVEDDYGDGHTSKRFYDHQITAEQLYLAEKTRKLIKKEIGTYQELKVINTNSEGYSKEKVDMAKNIAVQALQLQWVIGDADKAESSFFKINTQGTPLDKVEEKLLKNRKKSVAIAARSIVRAGTGHKYWSKFDEGKKEQIEKISKEMFDLLFEPEVDQPIKTLDLPLGGNVSYGASLDLMMDFIILTIANTSAKKISIESLSDDIDGNATLEVLQNCKKVTERFAGNSHGSVGLHPAIYFYNHMGKPNKILFLVFTSLFADAVNNNDKQFFIKFSTARNKIEGFFKTNKPLIAQILTLTRSQNRLPLIKDLMQYMIDTAVAGEEITPDNIAKQAKVELAVLKENKVSSQTISNENKNQAFLRESLESAIKCSVCLGLIPKSAISYDHENPKNMGGMGDVNNTQLTHPYCNTAIKNQSDNPKDKVA